MRFKSFLFDLDGTLADSEPLKGKALSLALQHFKGMAPAEIYKDVMGKSWEDVTDHFFTTGQVRVPLEDFDPIFRKIYEQLIDKELVTKPYLSDLIRSAKSKNIKIALVSSASRWMVEKILSKLSVKNWFDLIVSREDVLLHKPDPSAYLLAMNKLGTLPSESLVFEDSESGIEAARRAKCPYIFIKHDFNQQHKHIGSLMAVDSFQNMDKRIL